MRRSEGFSLVELMIAMVVGLVVVLGAGKLLLSVFQTKSQVQALSEKQVAVNFSSETMLSDIRCAEPGSIDWSDNGSGVLELTIRNKSGLAGSAMCDSQGNEHRVYRLKDGEIQLCARSPAESCAENDFYAVFSGVDAQGPNNGFHVSKGCSEGRVSAWVVNIDLEATDSAGDADSLSFHAINRMSAITGREVACDNS